MNRRTPGLRLGLLTWSPYTCDGSMKYEQSMKQIGDRASEAKITPQQWQWYTLHGWFSRQFPKLLSCWLVLARTVRLRPRVLLLVYEQWLETMVAVHRLYTMLYWLIQSTAQWSLAFSIRLQSIRLKSNEILTHFWKEKFRISLP